MKDLSAVQVHEEDEESGDHRGAERDEGVLRVRVREDRRHERPGSRHGSAARRCRRSWFPLNNHAWEHYGNLVTYMRLKGIVPPSSERPPTQ